MAKVSWCKGQSPSHRDQERLQWGYRNFLTASLSLITTYFLLLFFSFFKSINSRTLISESCFIDYVSFELCIVIGACLKAENSASVGITEVYQAGNFRDRRSPFK